MILPRAKQIKEYKTELKIVPPIRVYGSKRFSSFAVRYLQKLKIEVKAIGNAQGADLLLEEKKYSRREEYCLRVKDRITISAENVSGLRNAISSFAQCLVKKGESYRIRRLELSDYPDNDYRGVMIDLARGLPDKDRLKEDILRLALVKCNTIHLHLMDRQGICYDTKLFKHPSEIRSTKLYQKSDLKELVKYCKSLAIDIIPEIEVPSHAHVLVEYNPFLACKVDFENQSKAVVCGGNEKTYELYEKLIGEIADIFPYEYIHIGGDELYFPSETMNWRWHWNECSVCRAYMRKHGLNDRQDLYYHLMRKMHDVALSHGKKTIMWNDQIDFSAPVSLPEDMIVQFWRFHGDEGRYSGKVTYADFLNSPFEKVISPFNGCYIDIEDLTKLSDVEHYAPKRFGNPDNIQKQKIKGGDVCAWEYGNPAEEYKHYHISFFPCATAILDKMWNEAEANFCDVEYGKALTKLLLGSVCDGKTDVFSVFGSVFVPRTKKTSYLSRSNFSDAYIGQIKKYLQEAKTDTYSPIAIERIIEFLNRWRDE